MRLWYILLLGLVSLISAQDTTIGATNATDPTSPATASPNNTTSSCIRCDTVAVAPCPTTCPDNQVCVYIARTCGACARKECRPAEALGASVRDGMQVGDSSNSTTMWIIIGGCAAGVVAIVAGIAGFVVHRRRYRKKASEAAEKKMHTSSIGGGININDLDDEDLLDELGVDPLGARVRIRTSQGSGLRQSGRSSKGTGKDAAHAPTSMFDPPMTKAMQPWRRSTDSSIYSSSPRSMLLLDGGNTRGTMSLEIDRVQRPTDALLPPGKHRNPSKLRVDTTLAAGGARSKDSLERARAATSDLARLSTAEALLPDPSAPADDAILRSRGVDHTLGLLPSVSPSVARFSFASIATGVESGLGTHPISKGRSSIVPPPMSPVPAHPPPSIPPSVLTDLNTGGDARRVDDWWRQSVNARSTVFGEDGRPISMAYSDASSHAESVVQVAAARVAGGLQPVVGSVHALRASGVMPRQHAVEASSSAHNAFVALSQRRAEGQDPSEAPPTGSVYGML